MIAVFGSGPAGLMAADVLAAAGRKVTLFEKRKGLGRKLLIAGSSGLNITYDCPAAEFHRFYSAPEGHFERVFRDFAPSDWIAFIERELAIPTFKGTSRRYFVENMKASLLLKNWTERLKRFGVEIVTDHEWKSFDELRSFEATCLALGGGSYEPTEVPLRWVGAMKSAGLRFAEFRSANVGFEVAWPKALLDEAEGKPIKNLVLHSSRGQRSGELIITSYGLEGTPVYFAGTEGIVHLDLKPEMDEKAVLTRLSSGKKNLSPIRRIKKYLNLSEAAEALVFHMMSQEIRTDLKKVAAFLKRFPIRLERARPLAEAISSSGGLVFEEVTEELELKRFPGVYVAGEMLDWSAPTGGFLLQGCVSQGHFAAKAMLNAKRS